jgi:pimeloyl-ACP methyl ester carboxylesterase
MGQLGLGDRHVYYEHFVGDAALPTIVLSHGWGMSGRVWDDVTARLTDEGFSVVSYDHRNCWQSSKDFADVSIGTLGDDLVSICQALKLERVVLNGWSLGGAVVVDAAGKLGAELTGLISSGGATPRYTQADGFPHGGQPADVAATVAALRANRVDFLGTLYHDAVFVASVSDATKAWAHAIALQASPGADASLAALADVDQRSIMANLDVPALVIGGEVIAIPHNANLSNGQMFALTDAYNQAMTPQYAEIRARFEPLMEVTQFKGDSESHPLLSPDDEFADFETWHSWGGRSFDPEAHPCCRNLPVGKGQADKLERKEGEYARAALKRGLALGSSLGMNPFKLGLIGSTDTHSSLSTADSDNYFGKYSSDYPKPSRMMDARSPGWPTPFWNMSPAGYAAVWARENTREEIFAALKRREVYASTGPRITVRFFGGWRFSEVDADAPDVANVGYATGVPMGGELTAAPAAAAPTFLIRAAKDPDRANLDRIQVVKGRLDTRGAQHRTGI